jgi:hypothetical protein
MPEIYSRAKRTIVYLSDEPNAEQAISLLLDLEARSCLIDIPDEILGWARTYLALQQNQRPIRFSMLDALDLSFKALAHLLLNKCPSRVSFPRSNK